MRALSAAIVVSVAAHTAAVAWVVTREPKALIPRPVGVAAVESEAEPPVLVVELLDDHSVPIAPSVTGTQGGGTPMRRDRGRVAVATGHTVIVETPTSERQRPDLLTMRHPKLDHGPSSEFIDDFLHRTKPVESRQVVGDEGARDQIAMAQSNLRSSNFMDHATGDEVRVQRENLARGRGEAAGVDLHSTANGTYGSDQDVFTAHVEADGTVHLNDAPNLQVHGFAAQFDVTDWAMRSNGMDPYSARKLAFLDRTRDQRVEIGRRYKHQQLAQSAVLMQHNLDQLISTTRELRARKHGLFELWDECAETGDADLVAGGAAARSLVVGFIRSRLRGAEAYTAEELVQLNAHRRSKLTFSPYE